VTRNFRIFVLVGIVGFIADVSVLQGLARGLGWEIHCARVFSFLAASATTWRLNRRYTFGNADGGWHLMEWLRYLWSSAIGGLVNYAAFSLIVGWSGGRGLYPMVGVAAGSIAGMCVNYGLYSRFVFGRRALR
jgi:putative flippase GtrA